VLSCKRCYFSYKLNPIQAQSNYPFIKIKYKAFTKEWKCGGKKKLEDKKLKE